MHGAPHAVKHRRWRAVFIDAVGLAEKSGLPSLTNMLNKTLRQVMELVDFVLGARGRSSTRALCWPRRQHARQQRLHTMAT